MNELRILSNKYYLIIVLFSLISLIFSYENLDLWIDNQSKTNLPESLLNSEIIGVSSSNYTNNILYLIKEDDNSFLYINDRKYNNSYKEELTYLNSPLMEINDDFYFCSSVKNIIKLDSNGNLNKISNPEEINNYNNYELKCFFLKNENVIITSFINTPFVFTYDLIDSKWKKDEYNTQFSLRVGYKIYDANILNVEEFNNLRFGVLYQDQYNCKFSLYIFPNFIFGELHTVSVENLELYSKSIASFGKSPQQVYIFTYEPNEINKYNFFRFDLGIMECTNKEGNLYLTIFKKAEIYDAYFIENSPILFYYIRKKELNGDYMFYIGAVDIESLVLLYNIKIYEFKNVYFNYGFLYSNQAFLKYFEENNQIDICPFVYDSSKQTCQFLVNENDYYIFDNSSGFKENKFSDDCSKEKMGKYCIDQCPVGFQAENDECRECNKLFYYNYATKNCVFQPENDFPKNGKIIYNCEENGLKYYDENCYQSCSEIYGIVSSVNENHCISCEEQNEIFYEGKCLENCSIIYGKIDPNNINQCISCESINKIYFEENCYDNCSEIFGIIDPYNKNQCISCESINKLYFDENCYENCSIIYGMINPDNKKECISCKNENKIYYNSECYENCSEIYGIINPENENECIICKNENKFYLNDECVDNCSEGYASINEEVFNYPVSYCQNCLELKQFYYEQKCHVECPYERQLNDSNNICYFCYERSETDIYYQKGKCVSECDEGFESININNSEYYCNFCKEDEKYYSHKKKCENNCEKYSLFNKENNICFYCNETENKFRQDDICVKSCERGYETIAEDFYCQNCSNLSKYYYNGTCVDKCPEGLVWNSTNNICFDCHEELNLYFQDNKCVENCGRTRIENFKCIPCPENKKFFFQDLCYENCPNYTVTVEEENYCYTCGEKYQDGGCVHDCSDLYVENTTKINGYTIKICQKCGTDNKSWFDGKQCVFQCSSSKYASDDHFCRYCFCGYSKHNCYQFSDKCNCINEGEEGEIFGDNCEFFSKTKLKEKDLLIVPLGPSISTKKSIFFFKLSEKIQSTINNCDIQAKWTVFLDNIEVTDKKYFATGLNEETFVINKYLLKVGKINRVSLELNITNKINNKKLYHLKDEIEIDIQNLVQDETMTISNTDSINRVMNNTFILYSNQFTNPKYYKFYYKLLIKDEHNEVIPIRKKMELETLRNELSLILPFFQVFFIELSNEREEKYNITQTNYDHENNYIKYSLREIVENDLMEDYSDIEKIFLIMKYLDLNKNEIFENNTYESLIKFIDEKITQIDYEKGFYEGKEINDSVRYYINYYEPKTIFSLLNKIFLHQRENIPDKYFKSFVNIFKNFIDSLNTKKNPGKYIGKLPNSDILSFFRTFDHFLDIYKNEEIADKKDFIDDNLISEILNKLSIYLSDETYSGETIRLIGKRISFFLSHFGKNQKNVAFSSTNFISNNLDYEDYNSFSFDDYYLNIDTCDDDGNTLLCIKSDDFNKFKQTMLDKINIEYFSLIFFTINNKGKNPQNENKGDSIEFKIINTRDNSFKYENKRLNYSIDFPLNEAITSNSNLKFYIKNNIKNDYSNITCVPKNHLFNTDLYCFTWFNYDKNFIRCECNVFDEVQYVSNYTLAEFYKELQSKIIKKYNLINKINLKIALVIILIIPFPCCIYLLYDIKYNEKPDYNLLTFSERIKLKYLQVKILNGSTIFSFAFYVSLFKFPYLSPLRQCNYKSPKFIKHFIVSLGIFYGFVISLIPFNIYVPFKERKEIINKRDIKTYFEINEIKTFFQYFPKGLIFSFFGIIITRIFIYIFGIILNYNKDELNYWKEMKTIFTNYISNEIKRHVLLGTTWIKIKTRIIAYINICGDYILGNSSKKHNKNFENYLSSLKSNESTLKSNTSRLLPSIYFEEEDYQKTKSGNYRAPSINSINSESKSRRDSESKKTHISTLKIDITDNFQIYSKKLKKNKLIKKHNKFERIKNKYIYSIKRKELSEIEGDSLSEHRSFLNEFNTHLEIEYKYNFSYFPIEEFIINETLSLKTFIASNNTNINTKYKPEGYFKVIYTNIILNILLFLLIAIIFPLSKHFLNNYGYFIIKVWIRSFIVAYIIIYPAAYYLKNLLGSILLFKCYHLKNRPFYKVLFRIFVDKIMIYAFKVRNYITKYQDELDY